ncbi:FKBP-type peptidyl-prolyl cis-trans isomerase (plasmid) [Pantoea dispersa]|nr:FKBP-type peptidyl-prolyl cis-trans isomerase [Pantoea dispersa]QZY92930.1 FKBP-type peptidyl-prolyl cis-trans isomerase [Pantoea dispersa]
MTLPADKAFGDIGVENLIPPNATLIFDIKISL